MAKEGLFPRLVGLKGENFFTELVAYLFEQRPEILIAWLKSIGWEGPTEYQAIEVTTQERYERLEGQDRDSQPDMRIDLFYAEDLRDIILIESKLGSSEGENQLTRYANILGGRLPPAKYKWLVYITRGFERKDAAEILKNLVDPSVGFKHRRWKELYYTLKEQPRDYLIDEILLFMEKYGMDEKKVLFSASDLPSMTNLRNPFQLMLAVLDGSIQSEFQSVVGRKWHFSSPSFLKEDWARFALEGVIVEGGMQCILGFIGLAGRDPGDPYLSVYLQVFPESEYKRNDNLRPDLIALLKKVYDQKIHDQERGWVEENLNEPNLYSFIGKRLSLKELFMEEEFSKDVVSGCRNVLFEFLDEVKKIKKDYPEIKWKVQP